MKIEGYEEISEEEYDELPDDEGIDIFNAYENKDYYFKKAQKFPIVFEDKYREIEVDKAGIWVRSKGDSASIHFGYAGSFPLLAKAVEKAKKVAKKDEN